MVGMPVTTRKRKAAEPKVQQPELLNPSPDPKVKRGPGSGVQYKDDDPFESAFNNIDDQSSAGESDVSNYGNTRGRSRKKSTSRRRPVKRRKTQNIGPGRAPEAPQLSDNEFDEDEDDDTMFSNRPAAPTPAISTSTATSSPSIIRLQVGAHTTVNLNVADLLRQSRLNFDPATSPIAETTAVGRAESISLEKKNLFTGFPAEIRNRIYRMVLVSDPPILFHKRDNFQRSGQFLRTCRLIAAEGTDVMYGENSFHFERTAEKRGKFWEETWKEIGFKDIRRFLEYIGSVNVSKLKHISFVLEDGAPYLNPGMVERRYVNDPVLHQIFNTIAGYATLSRIDVVLSGRSQVVLTDYHFLKALSGIRAPVVNFPRKAKGYTARVQDTVLDKLTSIMASSEAKGTNVDETKVRKKIKMHFDQPTKDKYNKFDW